MNKKSGNMKNKIDIYKLGYVLCITLFVIGLRLSLTWSYNSRLSGISLCLLSITLTYVIYRKKSPVIQKETFQMDVTQLLLGVSLVALALMYNFIASDNFGPFDLGMIIAGFSIILLNTGALSFLQIRKKSISFVTYFLFITMVLYGFLFSGLPFILNDKDNNILFDLVTRYVAAISAFALNFIEPTTYNEGIVNFNGLRVAIGYACSGVESISIFISSAIAYMVSIKSKDYKKMLTYLLMGIGILYAVNILRVMSIILAGYYIGMDAFNLVHRHLGWVFFVIGMSIFWYMLVNNFDSEEK